jgi:3-isopropylmalate dehydrogenase
MLLRYSFNQPELASRLEQAVKTVLGKGWRTPDIYNEGDIKVGTEQMGDGVAKALNELVN